jgi:3-hydroxybutyryl-CoA dehydrogenase
MSSSRLDRLTVLGAGVLGGQIGWHSAYKGKTVVVYDPFPEALQKARAAHATYAQVYTADLGASAAALAATQARLTLSGDLKTAVAGADLVIEAVPEIPDVKTQVYRQMAGLLPSHTLVATNSSTFLPRDFAEATGRPAKFCALHFANLIWRLNLAEVMAHPGTAAETLAAVTNFAVEIGMVPVAVQKEQNGYVLNSWFVPLLNSAISLVVNGVATPEDVDRTFMIANRGCAMGPCGMVDMVGMKTAYDVCSYWGMANNDVQMLKNAAYLKEQFLDKGLQGMLGGKGFYAYPAPAYAAPGFLAVPDSSAVTEVVARLMPK